MSLFLFSESIKYSLIYLKKINNFALSKILEDKYKIPIK